MRRAGIEKRQSGNLRADRQHFLCTHASARAGLRYAGDSVRQLIKSPLNSGVDRYALLSREPNGWRLGFSGEMDHS